MLCVTYAGEMTDDDEEVWVEESNAAVEDLNMEENCTSEPDDPPIEVEVKTQHHLPCLDGFLCFYFTLKHTFIFRMVFWEHF